MYDGSHFYSEDYTKQIKSYGWSLEALKEGDRKRMPTFQGSSKKKEESLRGGGSGGVNQLLQWDVTGCRNMCMHEDR